VAHARAASSAGHTKGPLPSAQHLPAGQGRRMHGGGRPRRGDGAARHAM